MYKIKRLSLRPYMDVQKDRPHHKLVFPKETKEVTPIFNKPGWYLYRSNNYPIGVFNARGMDSRKVSYDGKGRIFYMSWFERSDGKAFSYPGLINDFLFEVKVEYGGKILNQEEVSAINTILKMKGLDKRCRTKLWEMLDAGTRMQSFAKAKRNAKLYLKRLK